MNENKRKLQETVKCEDSFQYFLDNYVKVNNMDGLTCFETKQYQQQFVKNLETRNLNILFGERQKGKTTIALSHALYFGLFNPNKSIAVIGNELINRKNNLKRINLTSIINPFYFIPAMFVLFALGSRYLRCERDVR